MISKLTWQLIESWVELLRLRAVLPMECAVVYRLAWRLIFLVVGMAFAGAALAQDAVTELGVKQGRVAQQQDELEQTLVRLAAALKETEPDKAERVSQALAMARERHLRQRLERTTGQLNEGKFASALSLQEPITVDLTQILDLLEREDSEFDRLKERLEQLREWQAETERLAREEWQQIQDNERLQDPEAARRSLAERIAATEKLLKEQKALQAETQAAAAKGKPEFTKEASQQEKLGEQAKEMAAEMAKEQEEGSPATRQPEAGQEAMASAAGKQQKASEQLAKSAPAQAKPEQQAAAEELAKALAEMKQEQARQQALDQQQAKEAQDKTAGETGKLGEQMAKEAQKSQEAQPGQSAVQEAQQAMQQASQSMSQGQPQAAKPQQQTAQQKLEQAAKELQEEIAKTQEDLQEALRRELIAILREMLTEQQRLSAATKRLGERQSAKQWGTPEKVAAQETAEGEGAIARRGERALAMLATDGTGAVFTGVLQEVQRQLAEVQVELAAERPGAPTQALQAEIEWLLAGLLAALDESQQPKEPKPPKPPSPPQPPGPPPPKPLIDVAAQLKLLRGQQLRVNAQTATVAGTTLAPAERATMHGQLSVRQRQILQLTESLIQELSK